MDNPLKQIEDVAYRICGQSFGISVDDKHVTEHPFDARNIHPAISRVSKEIFDNGHYREATLNAFIRIEERVKEKCSVEGIGFRLMMNVFNEENPQIALNELSDDSEMSEQKGYRHMFAGAMSGIRNPRAHSTLHDTMNECLDHLSIASALMRKIDSTED